jgi:hypothetical protein
MERCEQAPGLNMLQHGQMVHQKYRQLIDQLERGEAECPELLKLYERYKPSLPSPAELERYHVYHDCGKNLCLEIDCSGKKHFPNHAEVSSEQYLKIFPDDSFTASLIRSDMDFHTLRGDDLVRLCKRPIAPILYLTAWAEIHANAEMFGGRSSESYKIKRSRLIQAGKKLLNA